jgi:hypothetical protein
VVTLLHDCFQTEPRFGSKFVYSIDRTLQVFLDRVSRSRDVSLDIGAHYLERAPAELMDQIERGITIAVSLPLALSPRKSSTTTVIGGPSTKKAKTAEPKTAAKPAPRAASYRHPSDEHVNDDAHADWIVAKGVDFLGLLPNGAPGAKCWPKFTDTRLPKKSKQPRAAPLCVRFQMTGRCKHGCSMAMAHVGASSMANARIQPD